MAEFMVISLPLTPLTTTNIVSKDRTDRSDPSGFIHPPAADFPQVFPPLEKNLKKNKKGVDPQGLVRLASRAATKQGGRETQPSIAA